MTITLTDGQTHTLGTIQAIRPQVGDVFVLHTTEYLSSGEIRRITKAWEQVCPTAKLLILEPGQRLAGPTSEEADGA